LHNLESRDELSSKSALRTSFTSVLNTIKNMEIT
jgi:hypothetical protein